MKLEVRAIRNDAVASIDEVSIPLGPGAAVLTAQSLRHLTEYRKRAFDRLNTKESHADVTAVEYRVEGNTLVVRVLQGMLG